MENDVEFRKIIRTRCDQAELKALKETTTAYNFFKSFFWVATSISLWVLSMLYMANREHSYGGFLVLPYIGLTIASIVLTFNFLFRWLAAITVITPTRHQRMIHFFFAILLLVTYPTIEGSALDGFKGAILYLNDHGLYVAISVALGLLSKGFSKYHQDQYERFPVFPLRWYAAIVCASIISSFLIADYQTGRNRVICYFIVVLPCYLGFFSAPRHEQTKKPQEHFLNQTRHNELQAKTRQGGKLISSKICTKRLAKIFPVFKT